MSRATARRVAAVLLTLSAVASPLLAGPPVQAAGLSADRLAAYRAGADRSVDASGADLAADDCPPHGLDPELARRIDRAVEQVRHETGTPG